jgi:CRP/FNR family transcriptional regulator
MLRAAPLQMLSSPAAAALPPQADCPACGYAADEAPPFERLTVTSRRLKRRETLFRAGDRFHFLYAVRSGTFKCTMVAADGREQVTGFRMGGDLLGLDALAEGVHATSAVALEDSEVVMLPYAELRQLAPGGSAALNEAVSRLLSREIVRDHKLMALRGSLSAVERVAAFLLNMSGHMKERGYSPREFHLRMTRGEIGSYLGINLETVSRIFSDLQRRGVLEVDNRHVRIADMQALTGMFASRSV